MPDDLIYREYKITTVDYSEKIAAWIIRTFKARNVKPMMSLIQAIFHDLRLENPRGHGSQSAIGNSALAQQEPQAL